MIDRSIRKYEISIWTLQDSFITVLKHSDIENKGQIQDPDFSAKNDGTLEFSFSLPMYYYIDNKRIENPLWYNVINGILIADMRKIKVIFNKKTNDEKVFEFLITTVTETHDNKGTLMCEVECEGLAFHELGKTGYKIELATDNFLAEWEDWSIQSYNEIEEKAHFAAEPKNNINYWLDYILKDTNWRYSIQMDWTNFDGRVIVRCEDLVDGRIDWAITDSSIIYRLDDKEGTFPISEEEWVSDFQIKPAAEATNWTDLYKITIVPYADLEQEQKDSVNFIRERLGLRRYDTIYEDSYVSSWNYIEAEGYNNSSLSPSDNVINQEKYRLFDESESNRYNLTQTIAETFGVYCKYVYHYDENYHIIDREIIFYNNFIEEADGFIDITYPYDTTEISRTMDATDIVTKMYIKELDDETTESGKASIIDTPANKSGEDYLLNFDYLHEIGTISEEQYAEISKYESKMHLLNSQITPLFNQYLAYENEYQKLLPKMTIAKNAIALDTERISANDDLLKALTNDSGILHVTNIRPDICYVLPDKNNQTLYSIIIRQKGIIESSIHIYKNYDYTTNNLSNEVFNYIKEIDDYGNLTGKIKGLVPSEGPLYVIYDYQPELYYDNIKKTFENRLIADKENFEKYNARAIELDGEKDEFDNRITDGLIQTTETELNRLYEEKEKAIKAFERMMGPALREGNWQPEDDYAKYGDKHSDIISLENNSIFNNNLISVGWDSELFDNEQKNYYYSGIDLTMQYYPCIDLSQYLSYFSSDSFSVSEDSLTIFSDINFIFQDLEYEGIQDAAYLRYFPINSLSYFSFLRNKTTGIVIPVLMITGVEMLSSTLIVQKGYKNHARIGKLNISNDINETLSSIIDIIPEETVQNLWIDNLEDYEIVYPRIKIASGNLQAYDNSFSILQQNKLLTNYQDYYILTRGDTIENQYQTNYYITLKPDTIVISGSLEGNYRCNYIISNTGLFIYLDAIQVLKENSYPKVEYEVKPSVHNKQFAHTAYNSLNRIVHINDADLKFDHVQGYISEFNLDLDHPWEDEITIANYKTKFEDLFSTIVAQTEAMKKNSYTIGIAAQAFTSTGAITTDFMQSSLNDSKLSYAFNDGQLTINEEDGIWARSKDGVVAIRGGGVFTATEQDDEGNWIWNTGILPSGINANLITTGQLDTNLIKIYAGNDLKYQINSEGAFAYRTSNSEEAVTTNGLDYHQYVVHNGEGLFLITEDGAELSDGNKLDLSEQDYNEIKRVEISWDGLILRDFDNRRVFYADSDTGNLTLRGEIIATGLTIVSPEVLDNEISLDQYVQDNVMSLGRNLLLNTADERNININSEGSGYSAKYIVTDFGADILKKDLLFTFSCNYDLEKNDPSSAENERGELYILVDGSSSTIVDHNGTRNGRTLVNITPNNLSGFVSTTFKLTSDLADLAEHNFRLRLVQSNVKGKIWNVKLERGQKATTWSACPEEINTILDGTIFSDGTEIERFVLNKDVGFVIEGTGINEHKPIFGITGTEMYFKDNDTNLLYYDASTNTFSVQNFIAETGKIANWYISEEGLTAKIIPQESASGFGQFGQIYLGSEGFSISDVLKIETSITNDNYTLESLTVDSGINDGTPGGENAALLEIVKDENNTYRMNLGALEIYKENLPYVLNEISSKVYWTCMLDSNNLPILDDDEEIPLGSVCVYYIDGFQEENVQIPPFSGGASNNKNAGYLPTAPYDNGTEYGSRSSVTKFGLTARRWNVCAGNDDKGKVSTDWSRAGNISGNSNLAITYVPILISEGKILSANDSIDITFNWCVKPDGATWDTYGSEVDTRKSIAIRICTTKPDVTPANIIGMTDFVSNDSENLNTIRTTTVSIPITIAANITTGDYVYILFGNDTQHNATQVPSLIYINQKTVKIGAGGSKAPAHTGKIAMFIKTASTSSGHPAIWKELVSQTYT